ncbi:hypothetical protein HFP70_35345 [Streptomyces sp. ARC14]|uniref:hypothetical protein n=1 Tax=Streptomyces sp. ARC14 TaxID=2724152 RepID=UPI0038574CA7
MNALSIPLTFCWHLTMWRGGSRLAIRRIHSYDDGQARTIGGTLSIARFTVGLLRTHRYDTVTRNWYRDFGMGRPRRFSIGGWRNSRAVPLSSGWMFGNPPDQPRDIIGFTVTIASRTVYLVRLYTRADQRAHLFYRQPLRRLRRKR